VLANLRVVISVEAASLSLDRIRNTFHKYCGNGNTEAWRGSLSRIRHGLGATLDLHFDSEQPEQL